MAAIEGNWEAIYLVWKYIAFIEFYKKKTGSYSSHTVHIFFVMKIIFFFK